MHHVFESNLDRNPDAVAVVHDGERLTYRELEARANQVAHALKTLGVGPEVPVGLGTGRCLEMMVGLLGILKAGGAYVPLDPTYPTQRLGFILEEARPPVVVTRAAVGSALPKGPAHLLRLDLDSSWRAQPTTRPPCAAGPGNLAYILFTSGSTGRPKGVLVEHQGVARLSEALGRACRITPGRVLQHASINFDSSVAEMLLSWASGGSLHLPPEDARLPGPELSRFLREQAITHAVFPPSLLAVLPPDGLAELRFVMSVGEACTSPVVARWGAGRQLFNGYGPTETIVFATIHECTPEDARVQRPPPIGRLIEGRSAYILDERMQPVSDGETGELFLGGSGIARGYLGHPELTAERFVPGSGLGERLYRTGDLVRIRNGRFEYAGRVDDQVKIRGNRVEPGEVEAALARHPAVQAVCVLGREDTPGDKRLVAYLVVRSGQSPGPSGWRQFVRELLPEYMVPSAFVELPALPVSPNGKVNRYALPAPGRRRPELDTVFRAPETPLERAMESIWSHALGVDAVGLDDDFMDLGGDSLKIVTVAARVREALGVELSLADILEAHTMAELVRRVETHRDGGAPPPLARSPRPEALPLSFAQQRLWFIHQMDPASPVYNVPLALRLEGRFHPPTLTRALEELVARHEALRTTFPILGGQPSQRIAEPSEISLSMLDLRHLARAEQDARQEAFIREELTRPFDLASGPLLRAHLVSLAEESHVLLLVIHHIVFDGTSTEVLVRELATLHDGLTVGESAALPELPVQYADYTLWQRRWLQFEVLERGLAFWRRALAGAPARLELPVDRPRPTAPTGRGALRPVHFPAPTVQALDALARAEGATLFMALLAALGALLHRCTGSEDILIGAPVAGRDQCSLEGLIGFFVNTLALRVQFHGDPGFRQLLRRVREHTLSAYAHNHVPFEKLVEVLGPERSSAHSPLFQVMLALQPPPRRRPPGADSSCAPPCWTSASPLSI